LRTRAIPERL